MLASGLHAICQSTIRDWLVDVKPGYQDLACVDHGLLSLETVQQQVLCASGVYSFANSLRISDVSMLSPIMCH